jgi:hypothetical protein
LVGTYVNQLYFVSKLDDLLLNRTSGSAVRIVSKHGFVRVQLVRVFATEEPGGQAFCSPVQEESVCVMHVLRQGFLVS